MLNEGANTHPKEDRIKKYIDRLLPYDERYLHLVSDQKYLCSKFCCWNGLENCIYDPSALSSKLNFRSEVHKIKTV